MGEPVDDEKIHVWLALDPETSRVFAQPWEFDDNSFPPGARGRGWPRRELEIPEDVWGALLRAEHSPAEQDELHRKWWDAARRDTRDPMWPELPT